MRQWFVYVFRLSEYSIVPSGFVRFQTFKYYIYDLLKLVLDDDIVST